jgi:hypothetical protein
MGSQIGIDIQHHVAQFLSGKISLHEFEDWFVPVLWDIDSYHDEAARQLAGRVHALIVESSRGDRTDLSFREELENALRPLVHPFLVSFPESSAPSSITVKLEEFMKEPAVQFSHRSAVLHRLVPAKV